MNAADILKRAAGHMQDRASTYDKPEGERSMGQAVAIFNLYHGTELTEAQGWHLLQILKDVRLFTRARYHADSAEDCVAYAALKAEALHGAAMAKIPASIRDHCGDFDKLVSELQAAGDWPNEQRRQDADDVVIWPTEERIDIIGQNGPTAESYAIVCASCRGTGRIVDGNRTVECPVCDGKPGGWLWPRIAP